MSLFSSKTTTINDNYSFKIKEIRKKKEKKEKKDETLYNL